MKYSISEGNYASLGVFIQKKRVIFTFEGEKEQKCEILLFDRDTFAETSILVPNDYCLGSLRSVAIEGINCKQTLYLFRINGEEVVDPYAMGIAGRECWADNDRKVTNYRIFGRLDVDCEYKHIARLPEITKDKMLLYKLHVRGFTKGEKGVASGTFYALEKKIPYLKKLGITSVECMPCYEFEELSIVKRDEVPDYLKWDKKADDIYQENITVENDRLNYWGYGTGNYFAAKTSYAKDYRHPENELKHLIGKLHKEDMEFIMEFFFPRGTNQNLILNALRFWVREYHVDGFHLLGEELPVLAIVQDALLSRTKLMFDNASDELVADSKTYQNLYCYREEYQYSARRMLNHMEANMVEFTNQQRKQGNRIGYINYLTSNNGFTLADLFMYNDRHNEPNGEDNLDGPSYNLSSNYGEEGPTKRRFVQEIRRKQWRNAIMMLYLGQGVPMVWQGDEIENSQSGNNNAYCQDNEIGWVNWKKSAREKADIAFLQKMIQFRKQYDVIAKATPFTFRDDYAIGYPDLSYHGEKAWIAGVNPQSMSLGMLYFDKDSEQCVYVGYNFFSGVSSLALPNIVGKKWHVYLDSADKATYANEKTEEYQDQRILTMHPQSICILIGK